jgi:hypothetical protein
MATRVAWPASSAGAFRMSRTFPGRPAGCGRLPGVNLAVIAAFTAAAISLVNVVLTARLTRGSQFRQWQRETALPITARILALSEEATEAWASAGGAHSEVTSGGVVCEDGSA